MEILSSLHWNHPTSEAETSFCEFLLIWKLASTTPIQSNLLALKHTFRLVFIDNLKFHADLKVNKNVLHLMLFEIRTK